MTLRATIKRSIDSRGRKAIHLTFPKGVNPFVRESILQRNLGPRPYGEGFYANSDGSRVCFYWGTTRQEVR